MKQNKLNDKPVTRNELEMILDEKLEEKLDEKLEEKLKNYPTKDYLNKELSKRFSESNEAFRREQDFKDALMEERLRTYISEFSNRILSSIDPLLKELETRQQDREIAAHQMRDIDGRVDNHEKRITKLEHS